MCELRLTAEEEDDVRQVYHEWSRPWMIYELVMKKSAKELDPRHFDPRERRQFVLRLDNTVLMGREIE